MLIVPAWSLLGRVSMLSVAVGFGLRILDSVELTPLRPLAIQQLVRIRPVAQFVDEQMEPSWCRIRQPVDESG